MRLIATDVARSVVCLRVCVLGIRVSCAKTAEPIAMTFDYLGQRNCVLDEGQDLTRSDKTAAMRPIAKLRWRLYLHPISITQMPNTFSELVFGETFPNPTDVRLLKVK